MSEFGINIKMRNFKIISKIEGWHRKQIQKGDNPAVGLHDIKSEFVEKKYMNLFIYSSFHFVTELFY
jgi:hypothetical protein